MTIVFIAAGLYHHISDITDALYNHYGTNFRFYATDSKAYESVLIMGHEDEMNNKPYYKNVNQSLSIDAEAKKWCVEADVCIIGCGNCEEYLKLRMSTHKLTFKLKERLFKKGISYDGMKYYEKNINEYYRPYNNENLYYLCIGHYAAHDLLSIGVPKSKLIKWGYFVYNSKGSRIYNNHEIRLLWVGRFIPEKRPESAVTFLEVLLKEGINTTLHYVGYGPEQGKIKNEINKKKLNRYVRFHGAKTEWEVRSIMRECDWFLFTSTGWEGWGVVLSEAMLEGMTCLATKCAGSSKELIIDKYNGILLNSDLSNINDKVKELLTMGNNFWINMGNNAKSYMEAEFESSNAACRLITLIESIYNGNMNPPFEEGVCSLANIYEYDE